MRGILTLEVLARMEQMLAQATGMGRAFRLCHFFDYVGGTSTGAIIAAGLARGMSAAELIDFYRETGPAMFDKQFILRRWYALYKSEPLEKELQRTFGAETRLTPENLECLLLAVLRSRTTDSPWPLSSNPQAKYNDACRTDCNMNIPLWQIVRASTAAPVFFPPEVIQCDPKHARKTFVFVDGGLTLYNNPAFLLYRMATQPGYCLTWADGEQQLLIVSVGTGAAAAAEQSAAGPDRGLIENVAALPGALMYAAMVDQDTTCRLVGRCVHGAALDREISDMIPRDAGGNQIPLGRDLGRKFLYARYTADLSRNGLDEMGLPDIRPEHVQKLDSVKHIDDLRRVGRKVAEEIKLEHFSPFIS
ncbi:MAG: patatin-like phospholipase family protein [Desulfobacterales bacterium]